MHPRIVVGSTVAAAAALLLGVSAVPLSAQESGRIQGTVTAASTGAPVAGAQVFIEGTQYGTLTNETGRYLLLNIPAGTHQVRVEMIGYSVAESAVTVQGGQLATVDLQLTETAVALEEIVVTGTAAATRRKEIGNSIAAITAEEIEAAPVTNPEDILAGRTAGVTIMANSGQPGAGGTVKIRGVNTVSQETWPLIYVDGIRIYNEPTRAGWGGRTGTSPLQDIAAEDIARIEVIKGAAATTLYGTEASGGVLQIFTKKGFAGEPVWNAEITAGVHQSVHWGDKDDPTNLFVDCGKRELMFGLDLADQYGAEGTISDSVYFADPTCPEDGSWTRPGPVQRYNLSVRGGSGSVTYFVSGNYGNNQGILPTMGSKDGGFRGNFTFEPVEWLGFALSTAYTRRSSRWVGDGNNSEGFLLNVGRGYRGYLNGGKNEVSNECAALLAGGEVDVCATNGYAFDGQFFSKTDHFTTGLTLTFKPTEQLTNRFAIGWDYNYGNHETTLPFGYLGVEGGYYWDENVQHTKLSLDYAGSYQNAFGESLASTFSWGGQIFRDRHRWTEIDVENFAGPGEPTLSTGALLTYRDDSPIAETNAGFFLQEMLGWNDRLFVTGGLRVDGNSAFGDDFGLQMYPKVSAAYTLSDYAFWPTDWFETFKLRAAVGESGKAPGAFDKLRTWSPISGDEGQPGFSPGDLGNSEVGPERTREIETGFDASLFAGRLGLIATVYQATTFDALVGVLYPPSEGFTAARTENVGKIRNRGVELSVDGGLLRTDAIEWRARVNVALTKSEAIDLDDGDPANTSVDTGLKSEIREGYPVPSYFGNRIMNPDEFADPVIVRDTTLGPVYPTKLIGVGTTIRLMDNLTLDALAEYQGGHYLNNYTGYQNARRGVWHPCFDVQQKIIAFDNGDASALNDVTALERARCSIDDADSDFWMEKADFTKLRSVSLTYRLPPGLLNFSRDASVTLSGRNLYIWTDYHGSDPEVQDVADQVGTLYGAGDLGRRDYYQIPAPRTFLLSFRFSF